MFKRWRLPTRSDLLLAIKLLIIMFSAYFAAQALGLGSPIWAAATAAIVSGGTPGSATRSGLSRALATIIGLGIGLLMHLILGASLLAAVSGFVGSWFFCLCWGLKQEMKLASITSLMTTLVVQGEGLEPSLLMAAYRTTDILLGSAIGIILSYVLLPQRAAKQLQSSIREHIHHLGQLTHDILYCYACRDAGADADFRQRLRFHESARELRRSLQREIAMEPTAPELRDQLTEQILTLEQLTDGITALLQTVERCGPEPSRTLLASELQALASAIIACSLAWGQLSWAAEIEQVLDCDKALQEGVVRIHPLLLTDPFSHADLFHLIDVVLWSHRIVHGFCCLYPLDAISER